MSSEVFSYESLVHAVSGAVGSVTAMTIFFPLDTARLRLQVDENRKAKSTPAILAEIIKEEGLLAPYRGWFPVICSLCCSNFVYFYCFHSLKANWLKGKQSAPSTDLIVGITAGIVNVLITTPLWVVNTRLKLQGSKFRNADIQMTNYSGILDAFVQIVRDESVGALWNGTFPSLLLVLNPAIQFMIYEGLKRQLRRGVPRELSSVEVFIIGAVAKAVATAVTYPLQTIQSILRGRGGSLEPIPANIGREARYTLDRTPDYHRAIKFGQYNKSTNQSKFLSSLRTVKCLLVNRVRKHGMVGLFKGLEAKLLQTVLTAALMFLLYEKIASCTFSIMGLSNNYKKR
ncbi:peroxisomal membrane protein PMP34 isoform X1 [Scophthalmus maximus]|uniref:peroxisomal membrane protein PMP34 isoform X1 n=1 Tax=Scophthalmus maximus TaxID=52904 RepID=UPI001FA82D20|nr:peroxisomal membrane protein PMP34 isoform X1 [Scophthalmus maximus]